MIDWAAHADDPEDPTLIYDQVHILYSDDLEGYKVIVNGGGRPSRVVVIPSRYGGSDITELVSRKWWLDRQDVAHALTCIEFNYHRQALGKLSSFLRLVFDKQSLPNLTELAVHDLQPLDCEKDLEALFAALGSARALRVLRISEGFQPDKADVLGPIYSADELLANRSFPPAFEYFQWIPPAFECDMMTGVHRGDRTYFRFLPTHDETTATSASTSASSSQEGAALTKRGRLQRIPSIFRTKISPIGVWNAPFDPLRSPAILDHSGVVPTLAL